MRARILCPLERHTIVGGVEGDGSNSRVGAAQSSVRDCPRPAGPMSSFYGLPCRLSPPMKKPKRPSSLAFRATVSVKVPVGSCPPERLTL